MFGLWSRKGKSGEPLPALNDGPPDSHRPSGLCPRCDKQSSFEAIGSLPITFDGGHIVSTKPSVRVGDIEVNQGSSSVLAHNSSRVKFAVHVRLPKGGNAIEPATKGT